MRLAESKIIHRPLEGEEDIERSRKKEEEERDRDRGGVKGTL